MFLPNVLLFLSSLSNNGCSAAQNYAQLISFSYLCLVNKNVGILTFLPATDTNIWSLCICCGSRPTFAKLSMFHFQVSFVWTLEWSMLAGLVLRTKKGVPFLYQEHLVRTRCGSVTVAVYGDEDKPALITYPDVGLNCKCHHIFLIY